MDATESLEALQARHRKEQRDLVARTTQKKKSATKKTRKGVNEECERLEQDLKDRQAQELAESSGSNLEERSVEQDDICVVDEANTNGVERAIENLSLSTPPLETDTQQPEGPKRKQNRAKARLARRAAEQDALIAQAAEEAANLPDQREQERTRMKEQFGKYGLQEMEIRADGHCLYAAVADQMEIAGLGLQPRIQPQVIGEAAGLAPYKTVRHAAADFIASNSDEFVPFMEEPLDQYLHKIRETGEWGGHMELLALARTYGIKINVLHGDGRVDTVEPEQGNPTEDQEIWLGYYKHNFGLGEHYNSLRKAP